MKNSKTQLKNLKWMECFRTNKFAQIMKKSALVKGNKIGCHNPFGDLIWFDKDLEVIIDNESPTW